MKKIMTTTVVNPIGDKQNLLSAEERSFERQLALFEKVD